MKRFACIALFGLSATAHAAKHPRFEPTDLELEQPGTTELDLQLGPIRGPDVWRTVAPDFELDIGLLDNLELDLDGAFAIQGSSTLPDNLWPSIKIGVADWHDAAWAIGVQVGPKLPIATDNHGLGVEGLALFGHMAGRLQLVLEAGGLFDPRTGDAPHPFGTEAGIDVELAVVPDAWAVLAEIGGIHYFSDDADQLSATLGAQYSPTSKIDLSLVVLAGLGSGSDHFGLLAGLSTKLGLW